MTSDPIPCGTVLWEGHQIIAVGPEVDIPENTEIYDAAGGTVIPGLINAHCHAGLLESWNGLAGNDLNEESFPLTPQVNAYDGINPRDPIFSKMAAAGITAAGIAPGNSNLIGGSVAVLKTSGKTRTAKTVREEAGLKGAMGEFPKRIYSAKPLMPRTRLNIMGLLRQAFTGAADYSAARKAATAAGQSLPYNLMMEKTAALLGGELPFFIHANRCDDIHSALRLAGEFDLKPVLVNAMEAHLTADRLAAAGAGCIVSPGLKRPDHYEQQKGNFRAPQILMDAGICTAVVPDSSYLGADALPEMGFKMRQAGMSLEDVLKTLTLNPARLLGAADRLGSLAPGNDADMVVLDGEPFTPAGTVRRVYINGQSLCEGGNDKCC